MAVWEAQEASYQADGAAAEGPGGNELVLGVGEADCRACGAADDRGADEMEREAVPTCVRPGSELGDLPGVPCGGGRGCVVSW